MQTTIYINKFVKSLCYSAKISKTSTPISFKLLQNVAIQYRRVVIYLKRKLKIFESVIYIEKGEILGRDDTVCTHTLTNTYKANNRRGVYIFGVHINRDVDSILMAPLSECKGNESITAPRDHGRFNLKAMTCLSEAGQGTASLK